MNTTQEVMLIQSRLNETYYSKGVDGTSSSLKDFITRLRDLDMVFKDQTKYSTSSKVSVPPRMFATLTRPPLFFINSPAMPQRFPLIGLSINRPSGHIAIWTGQTPSSRTNALSKKASAKRDFGRSVTRLRSGMEATYRRTIKDRVLLSWFGPVGWYGDL